MANIATITQGDTKYQSTVDPRTGAPIRDGLTNIEIPKYPTTGTGTITPEKLAPANNLTVPTPPTPSAPTIAGNQIDATTQANKQVTAEEKANADKITALGQTKNTSLQDYLTNVLELGKVPEQEQNLLESLGGNEAKLKATEYGSQIEAEQLATRRAVEDLRKNNTEGLFGGALDQKVREIETASLQKQADLSILQNAQLKKWDVVSSIVDRKIEAVTARMKASLEARKTLYEANKDDFDKEEKRQYESKIKAEDRAYTKEENRLKNTGEMITNALAQGVPSATAQKALDLINKGADVIEVAGALGQYAGDYLGNAIKRASLAKTNMEIKELANKIKASSQPIDVSGAPLTTTGVASRILASASNDKKLGETAVQNLAKQKTVLDQVDNLESLIAKQNGTGFLKGKVGNLFEKFGANADVGAINAQLNAIIPNLAKGTYGEVGVLTDNDIANYRKTLPRLDRPQDQNDAVLAMTLKSIGKSMENTLLANANSGVDVSGWTQDYYRIKNQVNEIEDRIGVSDGAVDDLIARKPELLTQISEARKQGYTNGQILDKLNLR